MFNCYHVRLAPYHDLVYHSWINRGNSQPSAILCILHILISLLLINLYATEILNQHLRLTSLRQRESSKYSAIIIIPVNSTFELALCHDCVLSLNLWRSAWATCYASISINSRETLIAVACFKVHWTIGSTSWWLAVPPPFCDHKMIYVPDYLVIATKPSFTVYYMIQRCHSLAGWYGRSLAGSCGYMYVGEV